MTSNTSSVLHDQISAILADPLFDDPTHDMGRDEAIWALVAGHGWDSVRDEMIALLRDDTAERHWSVATSVIWRGVDLPMPVVPVIALLHLRLLADVAPDHTLDENLVWSIVSNLKRVDYLSDYDPAKDPEVQQELARLHAMKEPPGDDELLKVDMPDHNATPASRETLLAHVQALRDDIARYTAQLAEIDAGRGQPGANAVVLRSALKHRTEHLALMEKRLSETR